MRTSSLRAKRGNPAKKHACFAAFLLISTAAHAAPWKVDATHSVLSFSGAQGGEALHGGFKTFTPVIAFDPAHPEAGKIDVTVDIASAFIDNDKDKNEALPTDDWFAAKKFPSAEFHSTAIRRVPVKKWVGPGVLYSATGTLTIRGISKPVTLRFVLEDKGNGLFEARGDAQLKRNDFGVGQGAEWASGQWVAYPVALTFTVVARK